MVQYKTQNAIVIATVETIRVWLRSKTVAIRTNVVVKVFSCELTKPTGRSHLTVVKYIVNHMNVIRQNGRSAGRTINRRSDVSVVKSR